MIQNSFSSSVTEARGAAHENSPAPASRPLFVLCLWRSGSSLLYTLLNQHSQIALLYEGDLPLLQLFLFGRFRSGVWRERWEFWNQGLSRHGIDMKSIPANVSDAWEATRIVYQSVARRKHATIWGEKTPHGFSCALRYAEKFPDARFLFLWRDMHDVIGSMNRAAVTQRFFRKAGFTEKVLLGNEKLRKACDELRVKNRLVHEVDYEDLISNTSQCMTEICRFLEIPFEPRMTCLEGADRSAISGVEREHHAMIRGDRIHGQRRQTPVLSPLLRAKIERYIYRWKKRYGGNWPNYPRGLPEANQEPAIAELWRDWIVYKSAELWDKVVIVIYALTPLALARMWRSQIRPRIYPRKYTGRAEVVS